MKQTTQRVATKLLYTIKKDYIRKRFKDKFGEIDEVGFEEMLGDIEEYKSVKFVMFEQYYLPEFHYQVYFFGTSYSEMLEEYFNDCDGYEDIYVYDIEKDKFFVVGKIEEYKIEEV